MPRPDAPERLYVLVRQDLTPAQAVVQTAHALADFLTAYGQQPSVREWAMRHKTLVVLGVSGEDVLRQWERELLAREILCAGFHEPDMGNALTALAVHPLVDGGLFQRLRLYRP